MKNLVKLIMALLVVALMIAILTPADASRPAYTGIKYPQSATTGTVTGMVTLQNITIGISGAYVAIVNSENISQEYANTTSDSNGNFTFTDVNATGDALQYQIYANKSPYGEGYSNSFGVNTNASNMMNVVIFSQDLVPTPTPAPIPASTLTPTPISTSTPTPTPTPMPTAVNNITAASQISSPTPIAQTPTSTAVPSQASMLGQSDKTLIYLAIGAIVILVLAGVGYFRFVRK